MKVYTQELSPLGELTLISLEGRLNDVVFESASGRVFHVSIDEAHGNLVVHCPDGALLVLPVASNMVELINRPRSAKGNAQ